MKKIYVLIFAILVMNIAKGQQFNTTGTTVMNTPGCYTLTNSVNQSGAVWDIYKINLTQAFDITLTLNFGSRSLSTNDGGVNCGGDGMSFILQPISTGVWGMGSGVGFHGITPSLGVIMDAFTGNPYDPSYQHISINKNGDEMDTSPNELTSYTNAIGFPANITDGQDHLFRFVWTPAPTGSGEGTINVYFGNSTTFPGVPTITYTGNIVDSIFEGNPNVYWGVSASTNACWNVQTACMTTIANFSSDTVICAGQPLAIVDNSISGLPITVWSWDFTDGTYDYNQIPAPHIYNTPGMYLVNLYVMNSGGFFSTLTHSINVLPVPNVIVNSDSICIGDTTVLTATGASIYTWNNGLSSGSTQVVTPQTTTTYIITGSNLYGCANKDTAIVTVLPLPDVNVNSDTICKGDTAVLIATGALYYTWSTLNTIDHIVVSPDTTTTYFVIGVDVFGCKNIDTSIVTVNDCTGIEENKFNDNISVYPNPAKETLTIETTKDQELEILNLIGQTIYTSVITKKAIVKTSAFPVGVYFIKLSTDKETVVKKFVKE